MTTCLTTIKGALRILTVLEGGEAPSAEDGADALDALNSMLHGFSADGIAYAHSTIALISDPLPLPDEQEWMIRYMLARRLSSEYGKNMNPMDLEIADNARRTLQGIYSLPKTAPVDEMLRNTSSGSYLLSDWTNG